MNPTAPIGVFDSGIGGLTILNELTRQLIHENFIYIADQAYMPYGTKAPELILQRCIQITDRLVQQGCKAIVVACNTATAMAIDTLRSRFSLPIIGVEPAVKPALLHSQSKHVAVLATPVTINSPRFRQLVYRYGSDANTLLVPCPGWVELIESGPSNSEALRAFLSESLQPLLDSHVDSIVLGCTHYPILKNELVEVTQNRVSFFDSAAGVSRQLLRVIEAHRSMSENRTVHLFSTSKQNYLAPFVNRYISSLKVDLIESVHLPLPEVNKLELETSQA
ncbi:MAG: glutamate racemase [Gammaproteobacteria bacterium]|nr:glutamate racemase [Gammaproteobacteria bacterium]